MSLCKADRWGNWTRLNCQPTWMISMGSRMKVVVFPPDEHIILWYVIGRDKLGEVLVKKQKEQPISLFPTKSGYHNSKTYQKFKPSHSNNEQGSTKLESVNKQPPCSSLLSDFTNAISFQTTQCNALMQSGIPNDILLTIITAKPPFFRQYCFDKIEELFKKKSHLHIIVS